MLFEVNVSIYRDLYEDLKYMSDEELVEHWVNHGREENRICSVEHYCFNNNIDFSEELLNEIDVDFYSTYYKDLNGTSLNNKLDFSIHYIKFGKKEGRFGNVMDYLNSTGTEHFFSSIENCKFNEINNINQRFGLYYSNEEILDSINGLGENKLFIYPSANKNITHYLNAGDYFKGIGKSFEARTNYRIASSFGFSEKAMENIADIYFGEGRYSQALSIYKHLHASEYTSELLKLRILEVHDKLKEYKLGLNYAKDILASSPEATFLSDTLDSISNNYYNEMENNCVIDILSDNGHKVDKDFTTTCDEIYQAYLTMFGGENDIKSNLNTNKFLIVADLFIPQCVRYRIEQKKLQLEHHGKEVEVIDWTNLRDNRNKLSESDVIIFYRVPVNAEILRSMAMVNASGKASFYEIDDLLFDDSYPGRIEDFGGYVNVNSFIDLNIGKSRFKYAAKYCRFGISSTKPLCKKLEEQVISGKCILHRNGLDNLNENKDKAIANKKHIDIFYGSGTHSHNEDFIDQALPALESILTNYPQTRLVIAGYLKLPLSVLNKFKDRIVQLPKLSSVQAYWGLLEKADINIAVLKDDTINGCKSELKWFEAGCLSIPSVLSTTENYRDVINHGVDAFLASSEQEWYSHLEQLILNSQLRYQIGQNANKRVTEEYSVENLGHSFIENIDKFLNKKSSKKRKIALVNVFFPPQSIGGATRVVSDNFDVMRKQYGDDIELVVFTSDDRCTTPYQLSVYQHNGVTVYRTTILFRENMDWHPKDDNMYEMFSQFLKVEQPDIIHFHCVQRLTGSVVEAAKDSSIPYIVTVHDAWWISDYQFLVDDHGSVYNYGHPDVYVPRPLPNNVSMSDSIERLMYLKGLLKSAKKVLTVSEGFASVYRLNEINNIIVNKNGISSSVGWACKNTSFTSKVVCGHIGGMAHHKGYYLFKDAILKSQPKNIEVLAVDHSKNEGYRHSTFWGEVPVTIIGRVSQVSIVDLYRKIDVLFAPSTWPESYGLVTREAAACGCWVVASDIGGIGEDIVDGVTGYRISPTEEQLDSILTLIDKGANKFKGDAKADDIRLVDSQVAELVGIYNEK
ncbi:TPA: glycosyltransferase [Vibrio parahaemolyticus]|nr:glycosyltransferase [Vibrio parahaemolyticus]